MKKRIMVFAMLIGAVLSMAGCVKNEVDICDPLVREYLQAKTEADQAALLERCSGTRLTYQTLSFTWEADGSKSFKVSFADNKSYENAIVYQANVASITPDGVFVPGKTYYWKVESADSGSLVHEDSFTVKDAPVRFITTSTVSNVRDFGGWRAENGQKVKYGLVYRGGMTNPGGENNFPEDDARLLREVLGIKTEIDLRTPQQDDRNQTVSILGQDAAYYKTPMHGYCSIIPGFFQSGPVFRVYSPQTTQSIQEIFHILANEENYPVYFHCNAGADRTGTLAYLINGVLGVSYEDLTRDFELTSFSAAGRRWRGELVGGSGFDESGVMQDDGENYVAWDKMHQLMLQEYGAGSLSQTVENYLRQACNVPQEDIDSLRRIMLEN